MNNWMNSMRNELMLSRETLQDISMNLSGVREDLERCQTLCTKIQWHKDFNRPDKYMRDVDYLFTDLKVISNTVTTILYGEMKGPMTLEELFERSDDNKPS